MVHLILTGATGLVGSGVLQNMLTMEGVTKISIITRKPVKMAEGHEKAKVFIHKDFENYEPSLLEELKDAQGCVWAQGISATKVSKAEYQKITFDYPLAAARAFNTLHPDTPFTFVYVSGEGATTTPGLFTPFFGKVKGQAEAALLALHKENPNFRPYNIRPAGVDPTAHAEIHKYITPQGAFPRYAHGILKAVWASMHTPTREMGKVMTELAMSKGETLKGSGVDGEGRTIGNLGLRRLGGL